MSPLPVGQPWKKNSITASVRTLINTLTNEEPPKRLNYKISHTTARQQTIKPGVADNTTCFAIHTLRYRIQPIWAHNSKLWPAQRSMLAPIQSGTVMIGDVHRLHRRKRFLRIWLLLTFPVSALHVDPVPLVKMQLGPSSSPYASKYPSYNATFFPTFKGTRLHYITPP